MLAVFLALTIMIYLFHTDNFLTLKRSPATLLIFQIISFLERGVASFRLLI